jgi:hypothetical protein
MRFAPPRASRAPVYTAPRLCRKVTELMTFERSMAEERSCWRRVANL